MLISEEYKALQVKAHQDKPDWGRASVANAGNIAEFCRVYGAKELLDYGCGKQRLRDALVPYNIKVTGYDPGIPGLDSPPEPHDFVACIDVLEHIEPEFINNVLNDLRRVTKKAGIFTISTVPASTILADGTNAHRIIEGPGWWLKRLCKLFSVHMFGQAKTGFGVIVQ